MGAAPSLPAMPPPSPAAPTSRARRRAAGAWLALGPLLVGAAALQAGGTEPVAAGALPLALAVWGGVAALLGRPAAAGRRRGATPWLAVAVAVALLQCVPLPAGLARLVAPLSASSRAAGLGTDGGVRISLDAGATFEAALLLGAVLVAVGGTLACARVADGSRAVLRGLALAALGHAVLALLHGRYGEDDRLLFGGEVSHALNAYGAFPHQAMFAAYEVVGVAAAAALVLASRGVLDRALGLATAGAAAASVLASGSRAGVLGVGIATLAAVGAAVPRVRRRRVLPWLCGLAAVVVAARLAGFAPLVEALPVREHEGRRFEVWRGSVALATEQPVVGVGLRAFSAAYADPSRPVHDRKVSLAENEALQWIAEMGLFGALLAGGAAVAGVRAWRRGARATPDAPRRAASVTAAGLAGLAPALLSSVPLHVPAVLGAFAFATAGARGLLADGEGA